MRRLTAWFRVTVEVGRQTVYRSAIPVSLMVCRLIGYPFILVHMSIVYCMTLDARSSGLHQPATSTPEPCPDTPVPIPRTAEATIPGDQPPEQFGVVELVALGERRWRDRDR
jgi:hypothetical protein